MRGLVGLADLPGGGEDVGQAGRLEAGVQAQVEQDFGGDPGQAVELADVVAEDGGQVLGVGE